MNHGLSSCDVHKSFCLGWPPPCPSLSCPWPAPFASFPSLPKLKRFGLPGGVTPERGCDRARGSPLLLASVGVGAAVVEGSVAEAWVLATG